MKIQRVKKLHHSEKAFTRVKGGEGRKPFPGRHGDSRGREDDRQGKFCKKRKKQGAVHLLLLKRGNEATKRGKECIE